LSGAVPKEKPLRKDLKVNKNGDPYVYKGLPHSEGQDRSELGGALLAIGTTQAGIMDLGMGIHFNTQRETRRGMG